MDSQDRLTFDARTARGGQVLAILGVAAIAFAIVFAFAGEGGPRRFFFSYLVNYAFFLSLALGALLFILIEHATRAAWSVVLRRLAEATAATMPLLAVLLLPILLFGMKALYPWTHAEALSDPLIAGKRAYLNKSFFFARCVVYFAIWIRMARFFHGRSVEQDASGDVELTRRMERLSPVCLWLFALTTTFASFDLLMSLDPRWYSTIFGVYYFAGCFLGFLALLVLLAAFTQAAGGARAAITVEHYHDVGKLLFAFVIFWAYIAFSQYMLIWYANLPEESEWIARRQAGAWKWVGVALIFGHFLIPLFALASRWPKRRKWLLAVGAAWMLLFHWVDLYWQAVPEASPGGPTLAVADVALFIGMGALFVGNIIGRLRRAALIPVKDPRLGESLAFENM
ncbi:MAG: quinol:cytochrome C oxidoreductase [Candidatus Sumerlaeota bacterium]|nr:quinol:cytochrome C oxidoreductase [Candidatus Sumerlaeota bacterium]